MDEGTRSTTRRTPAAGAVPGRALRWKAVLVGLAMFALAAVLAGCDSVLGGSDWSVRIGTLATAPEGASIEVPESVPADEPFTVAVRTRGGGCDRAAGTGVVPGAARITVVPRDSIYIGDDVCPAVLLTFEHEAELTFRDPGAKTVRFRVRDPASGEVIDVDRVVEVVETADPGTLDGPSG